MEKVKVKFYVNSSSLTDFGKEVAELANLSQEDRKTFESFIGSEGKGIVETIATESDFRTLVEVALETVNLVQLDESGQYPTFFSLGDTYLTVGIIKDGLMKSIGFGLSSDLEVYSENAKNDPYSEVEVIK